MAINTALQNQTCFNRQERSVRSTSIDCSGPRYCLLNAGMNLNELQLIAAGRVIDCLTQDPRAVLMHARPDSSDWPSPTIPALDRWRVALRCYACMFAIARINTHAISC